MNRPEPPTSTRRRQLLAAPVAYGLGAALAVPALSLAARGASAQIAPSAPAAPLPGAGPHSKPGRPGPPLLRARRLQPGDTIGLIAPSSAVYERAPTEMAIEALRALGFKVKEGRHLRARYGHFAGTDEQRAADLNAMFADPAVHGILALTGGSGGTRLLPRVDYASIARNPKFFGGFSDLTALINAIHAKTGLVTFHAPVGVSEWNEFSVRHLRGTVMEAQTMLLANPREANDLVVPKADRTVTLRGGRAQGPVVGGNLTVLSAMAGSGYWPSFDGAILFLEDLNEHIYRVDRMLSTLRLAGVLDRLAGVVLGAFTNCGPGDGSYGSLTLDEVFDDYFLPLQVPVYSGALIGHIRRKFTVPVGLPVEMDADAGTLRFLQAAVL
jgi:muramoyltetrapeptide carboxypeptidase